MTPSAMKIVSSKDFEKASGEKVIHELFQKNFDYTKILKPRKVEHISLAQSASLIVIAPATANVIAKLAGGISDDYLTTTILAATCPIVLCPSMNVYMWHHPATQKNIAILKSFGYHIIDPDSGMLACGYEGQGRLASIDTILQQINQLTTLTKQPKGKRILVTAGGTKEPIDDVRFITNKSSGKMGAALAEACFLHDADVLLLRSNSSVRPRYHVKEKTFETADELESLLLKEIQTYDICIHTAAVSDFVIAKKRGKLLSNSSHVIKLNPRKKILDLIKKRNSKIFLVAFKAEVGLSNKALIAEAHKRQKESHADMIVANHVGLANLGFESDDNEVFIIDAQGHTTHIPLTSKRVVAEKIVDHIFR
jgi:phosphopantothenoylcysteine decarboxylase/phosphopantothenate--cysteine ligase